MIRKTPLQSLVYRVGCHIRKRHKTCKGRKGEVRTCFSPERLFLPIYCLLAVIVPAHCDDVCEMKRKNTSREADLPADQHNSKRSNGSIRPKVVADCSFTAISTLFVTSLPSTSVSPHFGVLELTRVKSLIAAQSAIAVVSSIRLCALGTQAGFKIG